MLGAFYFYEYRGGSEDAYYGVEAMYTTGPLTLEAYVSILDSIGSSFGFTIYGVDARYDVNNRFGILAGAATTPDGGSSHLYAGIAYDVSDALTVEARYGQNIDSGGHYDVIWLAFSYSFGGDAKLFEPRDFGTIFPAY